MEQKWNRDIREYFGGDSFGNRKERVWKLDDYWIYDDKICHN